MILRSTTTQTHRTNVNAPFSTDAGVPNSASDSPISVTEEAFMREDITSNIESALEVEVGI